MDTKALILKYSNMVTDLKQEDCHIPQTHNAAQVTIATLLMVIEDLEKMEKGDGEHV